jgi:hypothetical protein
MLTFGFEKFPASITDELIELCDAATCKTVVAGRLPVIGGAAQ